eukprot:scaffold117261_cov41-Prasinocladus_malaysianus.AAC.2
MVATYSWAGRCCVKGLDVPKLRWRADMALPPFMRCLMPSTESSSPGLCRGMSCRRASSWSATVSRSACQANIPRSDKRLAGYFPTHTDICKPHQVFV